MKVLGISGLEKAVPFKRAHWPGLDEREYRITPGMNAAAALIVNGKVSVAADQERFSGKRQTGEFPIDAIRFCLAEAGVSLFEIDEVAHGFDFAPYRNLYCGDDVSTAFYDKVLSREALLTQIRRDLPEFPLDQVFQVSHPLAHAASAVYTSGWNECLVVVNDGLGEAESLSVYHFHDGEFRKIHSAGANDSIGVLYSLITLHLGFGFNTDEYKVMGLAPYGDPSRFRRFFDEAVTLCPDGSIRIPMLHLNRSRDEQMQYAITRMYLDEYLVRRRAPGEALNTLHEDVAAALQECLERAVAHVCEHFGRKTGLRRLALAGGVSLNCMANSRLLRSQYFDEVYTQPVAGDDGTAIGAALYRSALAGKIVNQRFPAPFLGPRYNARDIETALFRLNGKLQFRRFHSLPDTCATAARLIADGEVIAWSRGRMEYGSRPLGNRSILADPGHPAMRDRINTMLNRREAFRPFAPACTAEEAHRWFELAPGDEFPYMASAVKVRPEMRSLLPAVTHVNGSAQLLTVNTKDNPEFHALLVAVGQTTGRQMVLNTSFNMDGEPLVNTPEEAIETFLESGIDHLFLENFHVTRSKN